jgi:hypothetical protein
VKGAQTRSRSSAVLVQQTAEQVAPTHSALLILGDNGQPGGLIWWLEPERPMRAVFVVVPDVDPQDPPKVAAADDQQPVQALGTDRADPSLGVPVRFGRPHRRQQHLGTLGAEHVVKAVGELRVMVADKEAQLPSLLAQRQQEVAGLLGDPAAVWVGGHAGEMDPSGVQFDEEQYLQPLQPDAVGGEEVAGHDACGLLAQERRPCTALPPRCRV